MEIIQEEETSIQESNLIKSNSTERKEVMLQVLVEKYTADVPDVLIESEFQEAESNSLQKQISNIVKGISETASENNSNRSSNSSEQHSSSVSDKPVSRISKNRLKAKKKRVLGQSYIGYKKFENGGKTVYNCRKSSRSVKQRCVHINAMKRISRTYV